MNSFGLRGLSHWVPVYHLNSFESPTPKDYSCQVWLKSDHAFYKKKMKM